MQRDTRAVKDSLAVREPELRKARADTGSRPSMVSGRHDGSTRRDDQSSLEDACSYDLFDLQDSGLVAA
jgi:hypothetical protein